MAETRVVVRPIGVTFVNSNRPGDELNVPAKDRVRVQASGPECIAYFRYFVDVPRGMYLTKAEHELTLEEDGSGSYTQRRVDASGQQFTKIRYPNRPSAASGSVDVAGVKAGGKVTFNTTTDAAAAAGGRLTVRVTTSATSPRVFRGKRDKRGWPRLILTFEPIPRTPTNLSPAATVGVAKPWLSWLGHPAADAVQVQFAAAGTTFSPSSGFTSTVYTSGTQVTGGGEMDLATIATGWSGIAVGGELDWTVRQRLPLGWSNYAEPATVRRVALPVGTITNPGATTADSSPPIVWTNPVGTVAWQVLVDLVISGSKGTEYDRQANSGKQPGTATSWTPDMGGDDPGSIYRIRIRWWDAEDRAPGPNGDTYGEATLLTTFNPTANVAPLTSFDAVQVPKLPAVDVTWGRTSGVPDKVDITGGGVQQVLPGPESPTRLWTIPPNQPLSLVARAVANGERSNGTRTKALRTAVEGFWVIDPATGRGFVLSGNGLEGGYGSVFTTHTPLTAAALIHRVTSRRGLEVTMRGRLTDRPDRTRAEQLSDVWWLRNHPQREVRIIVGDLNVPAVLPDLWALFDAELFTTTQAEHQVQLQLTQAPRELP